ncbi:hypothetical protein LTR27_001676 [Elasticomyces elasticus]|nr:hypothetical protein LTR27_001676 [Elasticomyces elasticus]
MLVTYEHITQTTDHLHPVANDQDGRLTTRQASRGDQEQYISHGTDTGLRRVRDGTCRQLREECGPVFYASNTFEICTMLGPYVATRWTQKRHPDAAMEVTLVRGGWWYCLGNNVQHLRSIVIKYPEPFALYQGGDYDEERSYLLDSIGGLRSLMRGTPATLSAAFTFQWDKDDDYFDEAVDEIHAHRCSMSVLTGSWEAARSAVEDCMRRTLAECYEDEPLAFVTQQLGATRDLHIYGLLNDLRDRGVFSDGGK